MAQIKVYHDRNFQIVLGVGPMVLMTASIIAPAFPKMVEALGVTEQSIGLLTNLEKMEDVRELVKILDARA